MAKIRAIDAMLLIAFAVILCTWMGIPYIGYLLALLITVHHWLTKNPDSWRRLVEAVDAYKSSTMKCDAHDPDGSPPTAMTKKVHNASSTDNVQAVSKLAPSAPQKKGKAKKTAKVPSKTPARIANSPKIQATTSAAPEERIVASPEEAVAMTLNWQAVRRRAGKAAQPKSKSVADAVDTMLEPSTEKAAPDSDVVDVAPWILHESSFAESDESTVAGAQESDESTEKAAPDSPESFAHSDVVDVAPWILHESSFTESDESTVAGAQESDESTATAKNTEVDSSCDSSASDEPSLDCKESGTEVPEECADQGPTSLSDLSKAMQAFGLPEPGYAQVEASTAASADTGGSADVSVFVNPGTGASEVSKLSRLNVNAKKFVPMVQIMAAQIEDTKRSILAAQIEYFAEENKKRITQSPQVNSKVQKMAQTSSKVQKMAQTRTTADGQRLAKNVVEQFRKTRICKFASKGRCELGKECTFAHDIKELESRPDLTKTRLCTEFFRGRCDKEDCVFAHGYSELRSTTGVYKTEMCRWWNTGNCSAGASCRYAHSPLELHCQKSREKAEMKAVTTLLRPPPGLVQDEVEDEPVDGLTWSI